MKTILRPYQKECISSVIATFDKRNNQMCVLPTGSGKTLILSHIVKNSDKNILIIAHTQELLFQIQNTIFREFPEISSEIFSYKSSLKSEVIICSVQSAINKKNEEKLKSRNFGLIIIDECHRSASNSYERIISNFGSSEKKLIGFTATPFRSDKKCLLGIFGKISFEMHICDLIKKGFLCDAIGKKIQTESIFKNIKTKNGDYSLSSLEPVINTKNRNKLIVQSWLNLSKEEKTIGYCVSIKHAQNLKNQFLMKNVKCEVIHGKINRKERISILSRFKANEFPVLLNCNILIEGFDEPSVSCILMCRPTKSLTLYMQAIGRGLRTFPTKKICQVLDFSDFKSLSLDLYSSFLGKKRINPEENEKISDFFNRCKDFKIGTDIKVSLFSLPGLKLIGSTVGEFKIDSCFSVIFTKEVHYILSHSCGSLYTCHAKQLKKNKKCLLCDDLLELRGKEGIRIEKILDDLFLYEKQKDGSEVKRSYF